MQPLNALGYKYTNRMHYWSIFDLAVLRLTLQNVCFFFVFVFFFSFPFNEVKVEIGKFMYIVHSNVPG